MAPKQNISDLMRALLLLSVAALGHALRMAVAPMLHRAPLRMALTPMMAADNDFSFGDAGQVSAETVQALGEEERELTEKEKEIARLRAAEKFMMRDTGDATCQTCGYKYTMADGVQDRAYPIQRNTPFDIIPPRWRLQASKRTRRTALARTPGRSRRSRMPSLAGWVCSSCSSLPGMGSTDALCSVLPYCPHYDVLCESGQSSRKRGESGPRANLANFLLLLCVSNSVACKCGGVPFSASRHNMAVDCGSDKVQQKGIIG